MNIHNPVPVKPGTTQSPCQPDSNPLAASRENPMLNAVYTAYSDGSSLGNPGYGGWAYAIIAPDGTRITRAGAANHVTNNQMEIQAAIEALKVLPENAIGILRCDSEYVVKACNEWRFKWQRNGWRASKGGKVMNADLFRTLFAVADSRPGMKLAWVRGHSGDPLNELVDRMARTAADTCGFTTPMETA